MEPRSRIEWGKPSSLLSRLQPTKAPNLKNDGPLLPDRAPSSTQGARSEVELAGQGGDEISSLAQEDSKQHEHLLNNSLSTDHGTSSSPRIPAAVQNPAEHATPEFQPARALGGNIGSTDKEAALSPIHETYSTAGDDHNLAVQLVTYVLEEQEGHNDPNGSSRLLQFHTNWLGHPFPAHSRPQASNSEAAAHDGTARYGLYVAPKPVLTFHSMNKLQQRLQQASVNTGPAQPGNPALGTIPEAAGAAELAEGAADADGAAPAKWFDDDGELRLVPTSLKSRKERPARDYLFAGANRQLDTEVHQPQVQRGRVLQEAKSYRLDIELGKLEFASHPLMSGEDQLAARLLKAFRDFKKREAAGLAPFYASKLAALEDALLASRESLFSAVDAGAAIAELEQRTIRAAGLEREVAEVRQIKEEEQMVLARMAKGMTETYQELCQARGEGASSGLMLSVEEAAHSDDDVTIQAGLTRAQLDVMLLEAEADDIHGLPPAPSSFALPPAWSGLHSFELRRVETMCTAHLHARRQLLADLRLLQDRPSFTEDSPEVKELQDKLRELGPAPQRLRRSMEDIQALRAAATEAVARDEVGVLRLPRLLVLLSDMDGTAEAPQPRPRRIAAGARRYYAKLRVNGQLVDNSAAADLKEDFTADLKDIFSVKLLKWPQSLQLQLYEKGALKDDFLAEVFLAVPGAASTAPIDGAAKPYSWTSTLPYKQRSRSAAPAGSDPSPPMFFYTEGTVFVRCGWVPDGCLLDLADASSGLVVQLNGNPLAESDSLRNDVELGRNLMPPLPHVAADRALQRAVALGKPSKAQLSKFLVGEILDPNDPRNAPLLELLNAQQAGGLHGAPGLFRLDLPADVSFKHDRAYDKRTSFLLRRWKSGPYHAANQEHQQRHLGKGARTLRIPAILAPAEIAEAEPFILDALAVFDGKGADGMSAKDADERRDRALYWTQGGMARAIETREARIKEFAFRVRAAAAGTSGAAGRLQALKTDEVVREMQLPEFKLDLAALQGLLAPQRKLQPRRKQQQFKQTGMPERMELAVTLQRANYLPTRRSTSSEFSRANQSPNRRQRAAIERIREGRNAGPAAGADDVGDTASASPSALETFAEVCFQGASARTNTVQGSTPLWNEQVTLPYAPESGSNPSAILQSPEYVTINVFDEVISPPPAASSTSRGRGSAGEASSGDRILYPERRRRYLGCIRIPISTIYQMGILEGSFKLDCPLVILGYQDDARSHAATISIFAMLKPPTLPPTGAEDPAACCGELEDITRHAARWKASLADLRQCRKRPMQLFALSADGTASLVCRYLAPVPIPPPLEQQIQALREAGGGLLGAMAVAARFASLVPVLDSSALQLQQETWATTAEMLQMAGGGIHEHAHLLAGLFMELGVQAYVVVGASTAGASSAFVLTTGEEEQPSAAAQPAAAGAGEPKRPAPAMHKEKMCIWNPLTGHASLLQDTACEILEVAMVYNSTNIWGNIQLVGQPYVMDWNLADAKCWRAFFSMDSLPRELASVQVPFAFEELEERFYRELEARAEETVRDCLQRVRPVAVTQPSSKLCRKLRELLREVPNHLAAATRDSLVANRELAGQAAGYQTQEAADRALRARHRRLEELQRAHNQAVEVEARSSVIAGHILALPFSDRYADSLHEAVLNTGLHRAFDNDARFSMAAHVERTGVAFACCVWVYIACIAAG